MGTVRGDTKYEWDNAVRRGDSRRLQTLIKHGVRPTQATMLGALLHLHPDLLPLLKDGGADPNIADGHGETALGYSVTNCPPEVTAKLIELGADPDKESLKILPLLNAASMGKWEHVRVLLNGGANPNQVQWNGLTALLQAVRYGYVDVIKLLLEAGADPTRIGPDGLDSFDLAQKAKSLEIRALLLMNGANVGAGPRLPRKSIRRKT